MLFKKSSCESHKTPVALQGEAIPKQVFALCLSQTYVWNLSSFQWKRVTRGRTKDLSSTYKISGQSRCGKRVFLSKAATKPCPQSLAIPAVIYCFGISRPGFRWESLLHCHNFIAIYALIKWQGSHEAAPALSLRRIKQAFVSCRRSPGCLSRCMSVCFYSLRISSPSCLSSPASVTPALLSFHPSAHLYAWPSLPTCPYLLVCLRATWPDRCLWSFSERDWSADRPLGRLELPTAAWPGQTNARMRTLTQGCTGSSFNLLPALIPGSTHHSMWASKNTS